MNAQDNQKSAKQRKISLPVRAHLVNIALLLSGVMVGYATTKLGPTAAPYAPIVEQVTQSAVSAAACRQAFGRATAEETWAVSPVCGAALYPDYVPAQ